MNKKFLIILILVLLALTGGYFLILYLFPPASVTESGIINEPKTHPKPAVNTELPKSISSDGIISAEEEDKVEEVIPVISKLIVYNVPFSSQAPTGDWDDDRQQNACEEVSALMAVKWARGESFGNPEEIEREIIAIAEFEIEKYGEHRDVSSGDTVDRIFKDYFSYTNIRLIKNASMDDIKTALIQGKIVVAPADGQVLDNPHYTPPGPDRHMLVIIGYDPKTKEFITNDPGTKRGRGYRYAENVLYSSLRDYPTGYHELILEIKKPIIVVGKENLKY